MIAKFRNGQLIVISSSKRERDDLVAFANKLAGRGTIKFNTLDSVTGASLALWHIPEDDT